MDGSKMIASLERQIQNLRDKRKEAGCTVSFMGCEVPLATAQAARFYYDRFIQGCVDSDRVNYSFLLPQFKSHVLDRVSRHGVGLSELL